MIRRPDDDIEREEDIAARHREDERPPINEGPPGSAGGSMHAAGAGGTAVGGLAGSNEGEGTPNVEELEEAAGSGRFDAELEEQHEPAYAGHAGGAVGGTRADGGQTHGGLSPAEPAGGDATVGRNPGGPPRPPRKG